MLYARRIAIRNSGRAILSRHWREVEDFEEQLRIRRFQDHRTHLIYRFVSPDSQYCYIGVTANLDKRIAGHCEKGPLSVYLAGLDLAQARLCFEVIDTAGSFGRAEEKESAYIKASFFDAQFDLDMPLPLNKRTHDVSTDDFKSRELRVHKLRSEAHEREMRQHSDPTPIRRPTKSLPVTQTQTHSPWTSKSQSTPASRPATKKVVDAEGSREEKSDRKVFKRVAWAVALSIFSLTIVYLRPIVHSSPVTRIAFNTGGAGVRVHLCSYGGCPLVSVLVPGTRVEEIARIAGWAYIRVPNASGIGFVHNSKLRTTWPMRVPTVTPRITRTPNPTVTP